jgi:DNA-binding transcriptional regulator LsrR (DeoR family)
VNGERTVDWKFLTNHGLALICIAGDPGVRLRDIADQIGITERSAHRIVSELVDSGYVERERIGRRNTYEVRTDLPVSLALERDLQLGDLLGAVFSTREQAPATN